MGEEEDGDILLKFKELLEKNLIIKRMSIFIVIWTLIGISSFFFPYIYSIVPVYETLMCLDYY